jgi:CRP/FNR family transcriptional regulator
MEIKTQMDKESLAQLVRERFPFLSDKNLINDIAEHGQIMSFKEGEIIMDYNSYVRFVPLIISGTIKVTREDDDEGREMILYLLNGGDTCSMSFTCCMMQKRSSIRTQALEDTTIIGIPLEVVETWMSKYVSWRNFIMKTYDEKMLELVKVIDSIAFEGMDERLLKYLRNLADSLKSNMINITHQQIAYDLNASREAVSRLLKKLEQNGVLELGRNKVILKDK